MGLARRIRRKKQNAFMKDFKKRMKSFKKLVVCSACGTAPNPGENIDDWKINQESENIDLLCTDCFGQEEEWQDEV
jgi:hypothetical protein